MKVTCIMPTMPSRREWLPKAIECFRLQTYADRELVIVADEAPDFMDFVGSVLASAAGVDAVIAVSAARASVGAKRNIGCHHATGEMIAHFDDDDYSFPGRLADQVPRLIETGKSVTGYHSIRFTDGSRWWQYHGHPVNWAFDTSLCYRKSFWARHPFDEINDGLEASFRAAAIREGEFVTVAGNEQLYATIHPGNTGPRVMTPGSASWEEIHL